MNHDKNNTNHTIRILIADDEPLMRSVSVEILRLSGYETLSAENGQQALDILRIQPVDLILTDVMMPEMNGIELLRHIREEISETIPVIIVSGSLPNAAKTMENAHTTAMEKPYDFHILLETIERMIMRNRQLRLQEINLGAKSAFA